MKKHDTVNSRLIAILIFALGMFILVLGAICLFAQIRDLGLIVIIMAEGFWFLSWRVSAYKYLRNDIIVRSSYDRYC